MILSSIQEGDARVEFVKPEMAVAYAELAPLVAEALAFLESGATARALLSLQDARKVIRMAFATSATLTVTREEKTT